jgi:hypothetical protein
MLFQSSPVSVVADSKLNFFEPICCNFLGIQQLREVSSLARLTTLMSSTKDKHRFVSDLHQSTGWTNFFIIVGGWPPWIYNRNKKKLIKCHIMNIPTMGMEIFLSHMQSQKTIFEISANQ